MASTHAHIIHVLDYIAWFEIPIAGFLEFITIHYLITQIMRYFKNNVVTFQRRVCNYINTLTGRE